MMDLDTEIGLANAKPAKLEQIYREAGQTGRLPEFQQALLASYESDPDNLLYAAWYFRLQNATALAKKSDRHVNWFAAIPLSILTGLIFWMLSDFEELMVLDLIPQLILWWSPIATISALAFLSVTSRKNSGLVIALTSGLLVTVVYVLLLTPTLPINWQGEQYLILAAIHLPLLSWCAIGIVVLGFNADHRDRFAFLIKSIEVIVTAGLFLIAGMVFGGITVGLFEALNISLPDVWLRLIAAGGFGLLPIIAVATVYDPTRRPYEQDFSQGLSRFIATMMRLLLPLTLVVMTIYTAVIPFNFLEPFGNRDILIIYNILLFAIIGLLLGATPIHSADLSPQLQRWLRAGVLAIAFLVELISIYAFAAIVYRTFEGGLTINRLAIIGWNCVNIVILFGLFRKLIKADPDSWGETAHSVFGKAMTAYLIWGVFLMFGIPLLFQFSF